ncbi:MAG: hypothetical protein QME81_04395 [bacterium]|nr:hypothetical protein [bacterium]
MGFKRKAALVGMIISIFFISEAQAVDLSGRLGIGLNYPGVSIKYGIGPKVVIEARGQLEEDITVYGSRLYYNFGRDRVMNLFLGGEADYVKFKGKDSEGSGFAVEAFVGGEYFLMKNLSLTTDIGPAYISLKDDDKDESEKGMEYVVNVGVNYYFGGGK